MLGSRVLCNDQTGAGSSTVSTKALANNALRHPMLRQATGLLELALRFSQENPVSIFFPFLQKHILMTFLCIELYCFDLRRVGSFNQRRRYRHKITNLG